MRSCYDNASAPPVYIRMVNWPIIRDETADIIMGHADTAR